MTEKIFDFTAEVLALQSSLRYFALSLTGDDTEADDLVQETLLKAFLYKSKFSEHTNLKAWLYTILKNIFINNYRKNQKIRKVVDTSSSQFHLNIAETRKTFDPDSKVNFKQLMEVVETLDPEQSEPLRLYFEGYKYKEIADMQGLPIGTIKSRIFLARKLLAFRLKDFRKD
jgi:RNA polymerase sigma-70 factor, ECF subfamily